METPAEKSPLEQLAEDAYHAELAQLKLLTLPAPVTDRLVLDFLPDGTVQTTPVSADRLRLAALLQAFVRQCLENPSLIGTACEVEAEGKES